MKKRTKIGIGAALLGSMAAAAAAYMYVGENAPARRKKVAAWMSKAEKEIIREAMKLKDTTFSEENFERIVNAVTRRYKQAQNLSAEDIATFIAMVSDSWQRAGQVSRKANGSSGSSNGRSRSKSTSKKSTAAASRR